MNLWYEILQITNDIQFIDEEYDCSIPLENIQFNHYV
jgi:hypothetical protein